MDDIPVAVVVLGVEPHESQRGGIGDGASELLVICSGRTMPPLACMTMTSSGNPELLSCWLSPEMRWSIPCRIPKRLVGPFVKKRLWKLSRKARVRKKTGITMLSKVKSP